jgi:hypothetical protein
MKTGSKKPFDTLANLGFLVLFPGFVVYNFAVSIGIFPAFLGGFFGPMCAAFAVVALVHLCMQLPAERTQLSPLHWSFVLFCSFWLLWVVIAGVLNPNRFIATSAVTESLATLVIWLAVFFTSSRMALHAGAMRHMVQLSALLLVSLFVFAFVQEGSFLGPFIMFQGLDEAGHSESGAASYQGVGRSILIMGIVIAAFQERFSRQVIVLGLTSAGLLFLGSRAHLFGSLICILASILAVGARRGQRLALSVLILCAPLIFYMSLELFFETRASEIIDLTSSESWQARLELQNRALDVIAENPLTGYFGYHHWGTLAGYSHNILSAWAGFGIFIFMAYLGLMLYALSLCTKRVLASGPVPPYWLAAFHLNIMAVVLALYSEPIFASVFPALGWGVTVNAMRREHQNKLFAQVNFNPKTGCALLKGTRKCGQVVT